MRQELYTIRWTQAYIGWPEPVITDLTQARAVLARIMAL